MKLPIYIYAALAYIAGYAVASLGTKSILSWVIGFVFGITNALFADKVCRVPVGESSRAPEGSQTK